MVEQFHLEQDLLQEEDYLPQEIEQHIQEIEELYLAMELQEEDQQLLGGLQELDHQVDQFLEMELQEEDHLLAIEQLVLDHLVHHVQDLLQEVEGLPQDLHQILVEVEEPLQEDLLHQEVARELHHLLDLHQEVVVQDHHLDLLHVHRHRVHHLEVVLEEDKKTLVNNQ